MKNDIEDRISRVQKYISKEIRYIDYGMFDAEKDFAAIVNELSELREFKERVEGQEKLYVVLAPPKHGPDQVFVEIETSKGKSVSIPRQKIERGRYTIVGPLFRHPVSPEGYKLVPIEPTEKMLRVGHNQIDFHRNGQNTHDLEHESQSKAGCSTVKEDVRDAYQAMISAAPEAE